MRQRSNLIVILGLAVFVVGAAAAWLVVHDENSSSAATGASGVLYATKAIPPGTTGQAALDGGMVKSRKADLRDRPATAFTDPEQLGGHVTRSAIPAGQTLLAEQFQTAQTTSGAVSIPPGREALAVQLTNVPGVAGFAGAGDRIDVFAVVKDRAAGGAAQGAAGAGVHRVMQGVEVLKVNGTTLVPNQGQPGGEGLVFLLAVNPEQAEHLVYLTSFEQLYFALVPKENPPAGNSPGADPKSVLAPVAG